MIFVYAPIPPGNYPTILIVLAIFALTLARSIYRGIRGRAYSTRRVLTLPVLYIILTIAFIVPSTISNLVFLVTFIFIFAGLIIGLRFGEKVLLFYNNGTLFYKRSAFILFFWLISFLARIVLELFMPANFIVDISVDSILALTSGLLIGEAIHIINSKNRFAQPDNIPPS